MFRLRAGARGAIVIAAMTLGHASMVHAQSRATGVTAGVGLATQYPDRFTAGCGNPAGAAPFIEGFHRLHRWLTTELALSAHVQIPPGTYCSVDAVPLRDGDVVRSFDSSTGSVSVAGEARVVLTPLVIDGGIVRVIGGGAWFPARSSPAWIVGVGYRPAGAWRGLGVDVERWNVGVGYDVERYREGAPREPLGGGREWQGFWQLRVGFTLWSR